MALWIVVCSVCLVASVQGAVMTSMAVRIQHAVFFSCFNARVGDRGMGVRVSTLVRLGMQYAVLLVFASRSCPNKRLPVNEMRLLVCMQPITSVQHSGAGDAGVMTSMAVRIWYAVFCFLLGGMGWGDGDVHASCGGVTKAWTATCSDLPLFFCGGRMWHYCVIQML